LACEQVFEHENSLINREQISLRCSSEKGWLKIRKIFQEAPETALKNYLKDSFV
jgi:hypothetical protein